jgi:hypothetical protein
MVRVYVNQQMETRCAHTNLHWPSCWSTSSLFFFLVILYILRIITIYGHHVIQKSSAQQDHNLTISVSCKTTTAEICCLASFADWSLCSVHQGICENLSCPRISMLPPVPRTSVNISVPMFLSHRIHVWYIC